MDIAQEQLAEKIGFDVSYLVGLNLGSLQTFKSIYWKKLSKHWMKITQLSFPLALRKIEMIL